MNGYITIKAYDILEQEVATLVDGLEEAGTYVAPFKARIFASGAYLTRLSVNPLDGTKQFDKQRKLS